MSLPNGWAKATIADIADTQLGKMLDAAKNKGRLVRYLRNINVRWGEFDLSDVQEMRVTPDELSHFAVRDGDIFVCEGGEPGRAAVWRNGDQDLIFQKALHRLRVLDGIQPDYLAQYVRFAVTKHEFSGLLTGTTIKHLPQVALQRMDVAVPPAAEQRRIVAKLDILTARLTRARAELDRVPTLAKQLRKQSVCEAFDGSLTANWRIANGNPTVLTDDALNEAYLRETGSARRKPSAQIEWRPSFDLPSSWRWVSIDQIVTQVQYGSSAKTSSDADGVPVLRMGNIQQGKLDWTDLKYLPRDHDEFPDLLLNEGDLLFNRTNSFELVGKSAVCKQLDRPTSFASYLIRIRPSGILPELLAAYLNSPIARSWIERVASQQVGQANVNGSKLKALGIPLPPLTEQIEMLERLNIAFTRADRLEAEAARARALLDRLEAAILAKAFRGELVPQDPNDEPASVLLDRIRAERAAAPKPKRGRQAVA
jgi:type I restriction enzyme S subunit